MDWLCKIGWVTGDRSTAPRPPCHVSFVCTGNICRSPMAALVFGERLRRAGLDGLVWVSSAGIEAWHVGEPADERVRKILAENGYPTQHAAVQINPVHLAADLVLAMDAGHHKALRRLIDDPDRLRMFRSFDPTATGRDLDVPDPYYGGADAFVDVLDMIERAMPGLVDWVHERVAD